MTKPELQSFPEVLFRAAIAVQVLTCVLILISLFFNAPLEGLADPSHTPNPAKAPWYFLGLQELLHYFPPVVAGVLVPTLVVIALIVIPYFNINIEAAGLFTKDRERRLKIFWAVAIVFCLFLAGLRCNCGARSHADHGGAHGICRLHTSEFSSRSFAVRWRRNRFHSGS